MSKGPEEAASSEDDVSSAGEAPPADDIDPPDDSGVAEPDDDQPEGGESEESRTLRDLIRVVVDERRRVIEQRDAEREETLRKVRARPDSALVPSTPLAERPTVQLGVYSWALIGMAIVLVLTGFLIGMLSSVLVPLVIALFPAAVLTPLVHRLRRVGLPSAPAAGLVLLGTLGLIGGLGALIAPAVADQVTTLSDRIQEGYGQIESFLASGPFGLEPIRLDDLIEGVSENLRGGVGNAAGSAFGVAVRFFEGATTILLTLIVLFFYLKDGRAIGEWVRSLFPERLRVDVDHVGDMVWRTIGGYIQGQLLVALVDAVAIGIGLVVLRVPLALPLALIVFFGGLFPVVGASIAGFIAALVALTSGGPTLAGLVILVVIGVQALEGNLLQPLILGRALELHPLAIVIALAVGGFLLGILGAFLAVPVAAASAQTVSYIRNRVPG